MRLRIAFLVALACLATAASASGWTGQGGGLGQSKASSLPSMSAPTTAVSGRNVTVSWNAPGGSVPVSGYTVTRYSSTTGAEQTIGAGCSGARSGLSCTEQDVPSGSWTYAVAARQGNWLGQASPKSSAATVAAPATQLSGSTNLTSLPGTLNGSISGYMSGQSVTFRLDDPTTGAVLSGAITPTPTPANGQASLTATIPAGTTNGSHRIYAIGSDGDVSSAQFTVAVPTTMTTTAWNLRDLSSGTSVDSSDVTAFTDGRTGASGAFPTVFNTARYIQFEMNGPLAAGKSTTGVNFNFRFAAAASNRTSCFYFDVRRQSTGAVLSTHGSSATPTGCVTGTTQQTFTTAIPLVTSAAIANDLRIRVYGRDTASGAISSDMATVTGSAGGSAFTLYEERVVEASSGTPTTYPWALDAAADSAAYTNLTNWTTAFNTSRYLNLTFPAYVPAGATVQSASFKHSYRAATTGTTCFYFAVYSGATLVSTHGSSAAPVSCNSTTSYVTNTTPLPAVDTVAEANNLSVRVYMRNSGSLKSQHDLGELTVNYTE